MTTPKLQAAVERAKRYAVGGCYWVGDKDFDLIVTALEAAQTRLLTQEMQSKQLLAHYQELEVQHDAAQQELVELRRDKERLDWLESKRLSVLACHTPRTFMVTAGGGIHNGVNDILRLAIDAALQKAT